MKFSHAQEAKRIVLVGGGYIGMEVSAVLVDQVIHRGDINSGSFSVWWLVEQRLVGAFVMNRPDEERELAPEWIRFARRPLPQVLMGDMMSLSDMERQLL